MTAITALDIKLDTELFIDGQRRPATSRSTFPVENPATGETIAHVADGNAEDAILAATAAARAQRAWGRTSPRARADILLRAARLLVENTDEIAAVITAEMGKPLPEAKGEVAYGAEFFRWFAEEAHRIGSDNTATVDGSTRVLVTRDPVGPSVLVTPWNFPLAMGARKMGTAIAAGCTMLFKPADLAPLTSLVLARILQESGLPDGVLNVVTTSNPGSVVGPWMSGGIARKISFTGSTGVGKMLLRQAAENVMRSSMELGGNAPLIVFADADLERAVEGTVAAKMRNMGEACTAANRIYVHRDVIDEFSSRLAQRMDALRVGDGMQPGVEVGPLIDANALAKVEHLVDDAVSRGAKVLTGGYRPSGDGFFYKPTVLIDVPQDAELNHAELFGPVAPISVFDTNEEVLERANDTDWGLVGYVFTQDIDRAHRFSADLEVGMVGVNTGSVSNPAAPFGGVKQSGIGREGGHVGIEEFLEYKYTAILAPRSGD